MRGTTPTHKFTLPFDTSLIKEVMVIYAQDDVEVFHKSTDECILEGNTVTTKLTQIETLSLAQDRPVSVQLRALTLEGDAIKTKPRMLSPGVCYNDEVLI